MFDSKLKITYIGITTVAAIAAVVYFFIPAFRGDVLIDPGIRLGGFEIRWYGIIMALSILAAYFVVRKNSWKFGISANDIDDYAFWAVIAGLIGARLYYVVFSYDYFLQNPWEIYQIWNGGLAIYGAILGGIVFTYWYARKKAYTFGQLLDVVALGLPLGQAIGRFGNFFNYEAFGLPTSLPWKMYLPPQYRPAEFLSEQFYHPAFLYESLFDLLVFFLLYKLIRKTKRGELGLIYLAAYSLGRFFIETIRLDSFIIGGFRVDQVVAFLVLLVSGFMILQKHRKPTTSQ